MDPRSPDSSSGARPVEEHDRHRVLSIRGTAYCDSSCVFCVEKYNHFNLIAPGPDLTRDLIERGAGKYNMLFFMNGEPTRNARLFEYVDLAKELGYRYFGMSSHFRTFADPHFALKTLEAGFEYFDVSLHAATLADQLAVNPIDDEGRSLVEALHGIRNLLEVARRTGRRAQITHKIVISQLNVRDLHAIYLQTYRLGVRRYILQPVKASFLSGERPDQLSISEAEFMPHLNAFLKRVEASEARFKLYGMSRIGVAPSPVLEDEINVIKNVHGRSKTTSRVTFGGTPAAELSPAGAAAAAPDGLVQLRPRFDGAPGARAGTAAAVAHRVTVHPKTGPTATFECREDELLLDAGLAQGVYLPFGCRMASCGACCAQILEGAIEQGPQDVLSDEQVAAGYALLCRARPRTDLVIASEKEGDLEL